MAHEFFAMNVQKPIYKLKGGTLLEVLISLSMLSLVFVIGMMLLQNLTGIHSPVQRFKTHALVKEQLYQPLDIFIEDRSEIEVLGRTLIRSIKPLDKSGLIYHIEIEAYWGEQFLEKRSRFLRIRP